jgi:Zn-dependent protease with chaperone function
VGFLLNIGIALAGVLLAEAGVGRGATPVRVALAGALGLALVPHALGACGRWFAARGRWQRADLFARLLSFAAPLASTVLCLALGWTEHAARWAGGDGDSLAWPGPQLLLALAPYALYELLAIDARARALAAGRTELRARRGFQVRMLLSGLVPLVVYALLSWSVELVPGGRELIESVSLYGALWGAGVLALFAAGIPLLFARVLDTAPLPASPATALLDDVARRAGFRCRSLRLWRTEGQMANAAVVGFAAWNRVVLFTDALLERLTPRQLAAVFAHEIGHAVRHHVLSFASWTLALVLGADLVLVAVEPEDPGTVAALALPFLVLWLVLFGYLSRRFELEADLAALELTGDPEALAEALERVGGGHAARGWRRAGVVLCAVVLALECWVLVDRLPEERVVLDLRRGSFDAAAAHAGEGIDEELRELAQWSATLPDGLGYAELVERAETALRGGRADESERLLELAALRR